MTDFAALATQLEADVELLNSWLDGPASGDGSIVDFGDNTAKTPARMSAENSIFETVGSPSIATNVLTLNLASASVFTVALNANVSTLTISNATASKATSFILELTADGTPRSFTQPGTVTLMNGTYTPSSTNGKKDRLLYDTIDGTNWRLWVLAQNFT